MNPTSSSHRLRRGLPGYLILFAPHAFAPQRQYWSRKPPSPLMFLRISTHFTAHPEFHFPLPYSSLPVSNAVPRLSPGFHIRLNKPPTRALRPVIPINACTLCITAAAGTELAGASSVGTVIIFPTESALQPAGLLHTRGIAGSGFRPLSNIPHCCLP